MRTSFYFAHPVTMYDTPVERAMEQRFRSQRPGTEVENPNQPHHSEGYKQGGMDYFVQLCDRQDGVFFAPFSEGSLGAGVYKEVESFLKRGAPAFQYQPQTRDFKQVGAPEVAALKVLKVDDSRAQLKLERQLAADGQSPYADLATYDRGLA